MTNPVKMISLLLVLALLLVGAFILLQSLNRLPTPNQNQSPEAQLSPPGNLITPTSYVLPTNSIPPQPTSTVTPTKMQVKIYLVALNDNGKAGIAYGCGDSLVPVSIQTSYNQGVLKASLQQLLAIKSRYYGQSGLYNSLYDANLNIDSLNITDDVATIQLSGTYQLKGVCEDARFRGQLEQTVLQFPNIHQANIYINGRSLDQITSGK